MVNLVLGVEARASCMLRSLLSIELHPGSVFLFCFVLCFDFFLCLCLRFCFLIFFSFLGGGCFMLLFACLLSLFLFEGDLYCVHHAGLKLDLFLPQLP